MLFIINDITNWTCTAVAFAFERVFRQPARHLLGEIGRIILCKALQDGFQQDTVCAGRNHFGCGNDADIILFEQHLIAGAVVTVAGEAVELPDDDHIEQVLVAVFNHFLKRGAMVCPCRIGAVDVMLQYGDVVLLRESCTLADLSFDGFLALVVGRIAGVNNGFHIYHLNYIECLSFGVRKNEQVSI